MERVSVRPSLWSATALIDTDLGRVLVHGVVLPFHAEPNPDGGPVLAWSEFRKELARQATDWGDLRRMYPDAPVVVAGDLNQNLDGARWYGTVETRGLLRLALDGAGLTCLTTEDAVLSGQLKFDHLVDHICVSPGLSESSTVEIWERVSFDGVRMSDHAGVAARFRANGAG
jgi:endonuclease/exonuclease/phosphatase family metal-dependent hydrolase